MTRKPRPGQIPPLTLGRRGPRGSFDPFYQFERIARDDGKPCQPPETKAERELLTLLGSRAVVVVMGCLLAVVVVSLLVVLAVKL